MCEIGFFLLNRPKLGQRDLLPMDGGGPDTLDWCLLTRELGQYVTGNNRLCQTWRLWIHIKVSVSKDKSTPPILMEGKMRAVA